MPKELSPTPEQLKKFAYVKTGKVTRRKDASNIEKYYRLKKIDEQQYHAAERLLADALRGGVLNPYGRSTSDFCPDEVQLPKLRASGDSAWIKCFKAKNFRDALYSRDIGRPSREILWQVVVMDMPISSTGGNHRIKGYLLREALKDLHRYYERIRRWEGGEEVSQII